MPEVTYDAKRDELRTYFDRTAVEAWKRLTSDAPVGPVRATVRAGREAMRATSPVLAPGRSCAARACSTPAAAPARWPSRRRAAAPTWSRSTFRRRWSNLAQERAPAELVRRPASTSRVGDLLDPALGAFDYVVAMDSLIHYDGDDIASALATLAARTRRPIVFTIAPRTTALTVMHAVGKLFPRGDRSPAIAPISRRERSSAPWRAIPASPAGAFARSASRHARLLHLRGLGGASGMNRASAAIVKGLMGSARHSAVRGRGDGRIADGAVCCGCRCSR